MEILELVGRQGPAILGMVAALVFVGVAYLVITIDRTRANSPHKDDTQVGLKLVLYAFILAGLLMAAGGVQQLLGYVFGGFKGGSVPVRIALPAILVGGAVVAAVAKALLPRTNAAAQRQPERYFLGIVALVFGIMGLFGLSGLVTGVFADAPWAYNASNLAMMAAYGVIGFLALSRFGAASGWVQPAPPPPPPAAFPPGGGYGGPPQGGYGPPGGGYGGPPPGGAPPQGGYGPPQGGGGFPPQGGGFPPQGGGGFPPPGGGYPPR